ncbi:thermonuclease family protein [Luteococcus sp. OSA5]|uniref:thermonuclease family protein n=1 Tax=Luteococcus sp. OSA5 TaxID=3401630 RepID=UPI003B43C47A
MSGRARGEVIAALLVVALFCAVVGPVWWQRWRDGDLAGRPAPSPSATTASPSGSSAPPSATRRQGTVVRISDGDTLSVKLSGRSTTVRILNIDTPETKKAGTPVECLGPQASAALAELLPVGSSVELEHDGRRTDRYGRTLAVVYRDGRMIGAEMARRGLTAGVVVNGADTFLGPVAAAQHEAMQAQRGLYDPNIGCTLAGQVEQRVRDLAVEPASTAQQEAARAQRLKSAIGSAQQLRATLALPDSQHKSTLRYRYPAGWRYGQVKRLDTALATARQAVASK